MKVRGTTLRLTTILAVVSLGFSPGARAQVPPADPCHEERVELAEPVPLCGTTSIAGDEAGVIRVHVPETISIREQFGGEDPDIEITGSGRFVGFVLAKDDPERRGETPMLLAGRVRTSPGFFWSGEVFQSANGVGSPAELEAGAYLLYLLADGSPVEVTLRLRSLSGEIAVTPQRSVHFDTGPPDANIDTGNVYAGGVTSELPGVGLAFQALWVGPFVTGPAASYKTCRYRGRPPEPDAYLPPCRGAEVSDSEVVVVPGGFALRSLAPKVGAGTWSYGGSFEMVGVPSTYGHEVFFLSYD